MLADLERRKDAAATEVEHGRVTELEQLGDFVGLEDPEFRHYVDRGFSGHFAGFGQWGTTGEVCDR